MQVFKPRYSGVKRFGRIVGRYSEKYPPSLRRIKRDSLLLISQVQERITRYKDEIAVVEADARRAGYTAQSLTEACKAGENLYTSMRSEFADFRYYTDKILTIQEYIGIWEIFLDEFTRCHNQFTESVKLLVAGYTDA